MKRAACLVFTGILASSLLSSMSYYVLELRGGSRIFAADPPLRKGRLILFHRYPDGVYMSLSSSEVVKVETATEPPARTEKFSPGDTVYIGSALQGPSHAPPEPSGSADTGVSSDFGYGYAGYGLGVYTPPPHPVPPPLAGSNIGPNGFPILAPPGSPGSVPPAIGSNGFPILAPLSRAPSAGSQPPSVAPRRP